MFSKRIPIFKILRRNKTTFIDKKKIITINTPSFADSIEDADIIHIPLKRFSWVRKDTPIIFLETAKSVLPIYCSSNGQVRKYFVEKGQTVEEGNPLLEFYPQDAEDESWYKYVPDSFDPDKN